MTSKKRLKTDQYGLARTGPTPCPECGSEMRLVDWSANVFYRCTAFNYGDGQCRAWANGVTLSPSNELLSEPVEHTESMGSIDTGRVRH